MPGTRPVTTPERVAIVAAGVVTPIGQDLEAFWSALVTGASGISQIERVEVADLRVQRGGEIKKIGRIKNWRGVPDCRATRLLIAAADDLCAQAAFRPLPLDPTRVAVVVGTALGGVEEGEKALGGDRGRRRLRDALYDAPAWELARWLGARGPVVTVSTACASGATALAVGADLLRSGEADAVVAGGYDALCRFVLRGFNALRSLSRDAVRPFDRRRGGLLLGEAGALGLLMRERDVTGARLGTLRGYGSASDGFHIAAPEPEGRGLERAIRAALADARLTPGDVDFVSAHGTATPLNDRIETAALKRALGPRAYEVPVNSIKGSLGHTMGAAAALEAFMCLLSAQRGLIPPTLNLEEADPECDLDYVPGRARPARPRIMLSTSMGFGGCNGALILEGA
jgi:3-oxoacyl-[acyl-carrier-protein] synthase II